MLQAFDANARCCRACRHAQRIFRKTECHRGALRRRRRTERIAFCCKAESIVVECMPVASSSSSKHQQAIANAPFLWSQSLEYITRALILCVSTLYTSELHVYYHVRKIANNADCMHTCGGQLV